MTVTKQETTNTESNQPHYFEDIDAALTSRELVPQTNQIVYISIGSYNAATARESCGYIQALPLFVEKFIKDDVLRKNLKIILCDSHWIEHDPSNKQDYPNSDLARHMKANDLEKYASNFYCVKQWISPKNFHALNNYLTSILQHGGAVFLAEYEGPHTIILYDQLLENCARHMIDVANRLYYLQWAHLPIKTDTGKRTEAAVVLWDGKPFNKVDCALLGLRIQVLSNFIDLLSGKSMARAVERCIMQTITCKDIDNATRERRMKINQNNKQEIEEEFQKVLSVLENKHHLLQYVLENTIIENHLLGKSGLDVSKEEFTLIKKYMIDQDKSLDCKMTSLIPAKYFPLLDFRITTTNQGLTVAPISQEQYTHFNLLDLFSKQSICDLAGVKSVDEQQDSVKLSSSQSTMFSTKSAARIQLPEEISGAITRPNIS